MEFIIHNNEELRACALRVRDALFSSGNTKERATILGLSGELGAGKTAFTQELARVIGIADTPTSPTFVIARFYDIPKSEKFTRLVHVDAYRIEREDELRPLGWDALIADPKNLIVVEWPEHMGKSFPSYATHFYIDVLDATTRRFYDRT